MPTYEYVCQACGHEMEAFQSMTAKPLRKCPECGKLKLKRKIGIGAGIIFKGSGFYETDYRSESYKKAQKADSEKSKGGEKSGSDKKADKSSDAKSNSSSETSAKTSGSTTTKSAKPKKSD